jgi:DNA repair protein RadC
MNPGDLTKPPRHPACSRLNDDPYQLIDLLEFFHLMSAPTRFERVGAVLFNKDHEPTGAVWLDQGCQDQVDFDLRLLARIALLHDAHGLYLVHSHPHSDDPQPSQRDIEATRAAHACLAPLGIPVFDHHIFGRSDGATTPIFKFAAKGVTWTDHATESRLAK